MVDINSFKKDELLSRIQSLKDELQTLEHQHNETIFLDSLLNMNNDQIISLARQYNIDEEDIIKKVTLYKECLNLSEESISLYSVIIKKCKIQLSEIILRLNHIIEEKLKDKKNRIQSIKEELEILETIYDYLYENRDSIEDITSILKKLSLDEEEKIVLSRRITLYKIGLVNIEREELEVSNEVYDEEDLFEKEKSENYDLVLELIKEYKEYFELLDVSTDIEDLSLYVDEDELNEINNLDYIDLEDLMCYIYSLITLIRDCSKEDKDKYIDKINYLKKKFFANDLLAMKEKLLARKDFLETLYKLYNDDVPKYSKLIELVNNLKKNNNLLLSRDILNSIFSIINDNTEIINEDDEDKKTIRSILLFDYDKNGEPYITTDLDPRNIVNKELFGRELEIAIEDLTKVLIDLIYRGDMETITNITSSTKNNSNRLVSAVKKDLKGEKKTAMYRIKPSLTSAARVVERKFVIHQGTPLFNKVVNIVKEILPNAEIEENKDFVIVLVYEATFKKADLEIYDEVNKRYNTSRITDFISKLVANENKEPSKEDLNLLKGYLKDSFDSMMNLDKENNPESPFDFSEVRKLYSSKRVQKEMN